MNEYWCIPPKENADFIAHMEDILDVYEMPYNPEIPVVCMDEKPYQMLDNRLEPLPVRSGDIQKQILNISVKGPAVFSFLWSRCQDGVMPAYGSPQLCKKA